MCPLAVSSKTLNMNLELPSVVTLKTFGTLPQDWALILNSNIVKMDNHDHAISGARVASSDMITSSNVDVTTVKISNLQYVQLATNTLPQNTSLYCDGTDLFWQDGQGNQIQITLAGGLNVTIDIGGFFGTYGADKAYAFLDGAGGFYGFRGISPSFPDTSKIVAGGLVFDTTSPSLTLTSLTIPPASKFNVPGKLILSNAPFVHCSIITKESTGFRFSSVYGDGSVYGSTFPSVPITDPNGILHLNEQQQDRINPNLLINTRRNDGISQPNSIELFANMQELGFSGNYLNYQPNEQKNFAVVHFFPLMEKIPHWDGKFSVNLCKWAISLPQSFQAGIGVNPIYKNLKVEITSVSQFNARNFTVTGTITNVSNISLTLPPNSGAVCNLRIAAIFPLFNGQGVFFGEQY